MVGEPKAHHLSLSSSGHLPKVVRNSVFFWLVHFLEMGGTNLCLYC